MTADRHHRVDGRGNAPPPDGAAAALLVVRGVVRGHVETAVGALRDRLAEPWTLTTLAEEVPCLVPSPSGRSTPPWRQDVADA